MQKAVTEGDNELIMPRLAGREVGGRRVKIKKKEEEGGISQTPKEERKLAR